MSRELFPESSTQVLANNAQDISTKETYLPILKDIKIPQRDLAESEKSKEVWKVMTEGFKDKKIDETEIARMFKLRSSLVEELFPLPPPKKIVYQLRTLIEGLKKNGFDDSEFTDENLTINLDVDIDIPETWKDPNSPADTHRVMIPRDPQGLSAVAILVGTTGYKIKRRDRQLSPVYN